VLNVVILNGGRGAAALIPALLSRQGLNVTSVINAYDDGRSTGEIRRFFGMLGPSDIRKVQELMLPADDPDHLGHLRVFQYRFPAFSDRSAILEALRQFGSGEREDLFGARFSSVATRRALEIFIGEFLAGLSAIEQVRGEDFDFSDCSIMNCIYAGAFLVFNRNIEHATQYIDRLFKLRGTVLPTSIEDKRLVALRENGEVLYSEAEIVELRSNVRVERIFLLDKPLDRTRFQTLTLDEKRYYLARHHCYVAVSPGVRRALQEADIIIYSAGTQHSSLYPTYLSTGLAQSIADNRNAFKVFLTNIGADYETPTYKASDYIRGAHRYLNFSEPRKFEMRDLFDVVFVNSSCRKADESYVEYDEAGFDDIPVRRVVGDYESQDAPGKHDGFRVVQSLFSLYGEISALRVLGL
jgi:2-phospho-L-lactate transferase/gluconeogenesis factor (CofD/UPF0052 family)